MTSSSEKFCLKWNDFQGNIASSYHDLRKDPDFSDVTLVCEENMQIEAHKIVLSGCSPFFSTLLKRNTHLHPMIYMRGLKAKDLLAIVDFIYHGEVNIYQEDLDGFLALAQELQLKGLAGTKENKVDVVQENWITTKQNQQHMQQGQLFKKENIHLSPRAMDNGCVTASSAENNAMVPVDNANTSMEDIKPKLDSMMERVEGVDNIWKCTVCGKETKGVRAKILLRPHIETHMEGLSYPCNQCGIVSRSRNALHVHISRNHRK